MPFFTDDDPGLRVNRTTEIVPPRRPEDMAIVAAAFRQKNVVTSILQDTRLETFPRDPAHNPLDVIKDTPYERRYLDRFVTSYSEAETRSIMGQIEQEENDRRTLQAAGVGGTIMEMVAGTLDPTIALPTGIAVKGAQAGLTFGKAALRVGAAGATQVGIQEALLQSSQQTRTAGESALGPSRRTLRSAHKSG